MRRGRYMIWCVTVIHVIWGTIMCVIPSADQATWLRFFSWPGILDGVAMVAASGLAAWHLTRSALPSSAFDLTWRLVPQQALVVLCAVAGIEAMIVGHLADGTVRPLPIIIVNHVPWVVVAFMHAMAVLDEGAYMATLNHAYDQARSGTHAVADVEEGNV